MSQIQNIKYKYIMITTKTTYCPKKLRRGIKARV